MIWYAALRTVLPERFRSAWNVMYCSTGLLRAPLAEARIVVLIADDAVEGAAVVADVDQEGIVVFVVLPVAGVKVPLRYAFGGFTGDGEAADRVQLDIGSVDGHVAERRSRCCAAG